MSSVTDLFGIPLSLISHGWFAFDRCFKTLLPMIFGNTRKSGSLLLLPLAHFNALGLSVVEGNICMVVNVPSIFNDIICCCQNAA